MNRINIICLGVRDMARSIHFYRDGLGFQTDEKEDAPKVVFFNTTGTKFELYPLSLLAKDIDEKSPPKISDGFSGITLAYNVKSEAEVHEITDLAKRAGAVIAKTPQKVFWGGYHAYFTDPDGYYWEVAYNPHSSFDEDDMLYSPAERFAKTRPHVRKTTPFAFARLYRIGKSFRSLV